jgi:hypothetical protein
MAIIYSYPITTPQDSDLFIVSRVPDDPDEISNFSVGVGTIAEYIIDKLIDPNAFDFQIPVFNQGGNRITGSIMSQDSSPSNGVAGTKITIAGNTTTTGDVQIDTLTNNYIPVNNNQGVLRDSGFYQVHLPSDPRDRAITLNTQFSQTTYGEYPDLRVASRSLNDPGVLDLFRPDGDVQAGDRVGILQYSLDDDARYAVAQIEVKTIGNSGTGNTGGGKLCIKTSTNVSGAQPTERLCIDNTGADFSVPINVTDINQSSFVGQVTIPLTPIQNTDAASKGYVDSQLDKDLQIKGDTGTGSINLDTQVFDVAGGTYIDTAAGSQTITVDISAIDGNPGINERYLTKNNTWAEVATIPGTYRFSVSADTGIPETINSTETLLLAGGTYMNTSVGIGPEVTFNHDDTTLTTTSSSSSPGVGGSFSVIDSITTNLQGHVTEINTLTVTLPQDTDNYVDGGTYSNNTGILSLTRTGGLADVDVSGFLEEAPSDGSQYARQNGGWSVVSSGGGGTVTGTGTTNTLPIWSDGPNGVLGDSSITQILDAGGNVKEVNITTTSGQGADFKVNGAGSKVSLISGTSGNDIFLLSGDNTGYYTYNFQMRGSLAVGRSQQSTAVTLDVGAPSDTRPAAWFRNGVVISNNPSGVQVDNTSMVIGAGSNDNVSGSDHCLIVGSGNQITSNSDQSVAFGQGNTITGSTDATAAGNQNIITTSARSLALGSQNQITNATSSFVAGGDNTVPNGATNMLLGYQNTAGSGSSNYILGNVITGTSQAMTLGFRNDTAGYPTTNKNLGLGDTKFVVAVGSNTTTNANALIITEGGINGGSSSTVPQVPRVLLPTVTSFSASNDAAADALGVPQGALYQNQGVVQINRGGGSTTDPLAGGGVGNYTIDVINSNTVGQKNYLYVLTGGSTITLTMPSSPSPGDSIKVVNLTTVTTCVIAQGGSPIMAVGQDMILDNNKANFELVYTDAARGWVVVGATGEI